MVKLNSVEKSQMHSFLMKNIYFETRHLDFMFLCAQHQSFC